MSTRELKKRTKNTEREDHRTRNTSKKKTLGPLFLSSLTPHGSIQIKSEELIAQGKKRRLYERQRGCAREDG